ncbi:MAG: hypothetical protein K6E53_09790 [Lachnospiraceae bacterium]|nr:hypothetical protein [Lachnospiraceae bacterium]
MMKSKTACCYLTHEHPDVMEEVLEQICVPYGERGIDIYVYDSSASPETKDVVDRYISSGNAHLHYVPMQHLAGEKGGDTKYLEVLKGYGLCGDYDYIWPTKDRCWFEGETLDKICDALDEGHDIVFALDERDRYELINRELAEVYTDPVSFFGDYGALTTNWECLIRRKKTMLDPIDWDRYEWEHNVCAKNNFNQTVSTLVRLSEMDSCSIKVIESGLDDKRYSDKAQPIWKSEICKIWIDKWIPTIYALPAVYDGYKLGVIKTQLSHISLFGSNDALIFLRDSGALSPQRVQLLRSMWDMISRVPFANLEMIMAGEEKKLFEQQYETFLASFEEKDYEKGYYLFIQNGWMRERFPMEDYRIIALSFYIYLRDMRRGYSYLFDGVDSIESLIERFRALGG